jgi:hypothetical protein
VLGAGEFVSFPAGDYAFRALGDVRCTIVNVWDLLVLTSAVS